MSRDQAVAALQKLGAKVSQHVSKKTSYWVRGHAPGSKQGQALKLNIPCLNEAAFLLLLSEHKLVKSTD